MDISTMDFGMGEPLMVAPLSDKYWGTSTQEHSLDWTISDDCTLRIEDESGSIIDFCRSITVSNRYRQIVQAYFPALDDDPSYWALFAYLTHGTYLDEQTDRLVLDSEYLEPLLEKNCRRCRKFETLKELLESFRSKLGLGRDFVWTGWVPPKDNRPGRCRMIARLAWPQVIEDALADDLVTRQHGTPRVYFVTGESVSPMKIRHERKRLLEAVDARSKPRGTGAKKTLEYMNHLPSNRFTKMLKKNFDAAMECALYEDLLSQDKRHKKSGQPGRCRFHQVNMLNRIMDQPQPFYQPSMKRKTVRIFAANASMLGLKKAVRRTLTQGWVECDMAWSQLAIIAARWHIPEVQAFLVDGHNIWKYLCMELGLSFEFKDNLKDALYPIVYGRIKSRVERKFYHETGIKGVGVAICALPLIKAIFDAREQQIDSLLRGDTRTTCYGQVLRVPSSGGLVSREKDARSILAQEAQAVEMKLIEPAFDLAKEHTGKHGFTITLFQHDGFCYDVHTRGDERKWFDKLAKAVASRAAEMNILTRLGAKFEGKTWELGDQVPECAKFGGSIELWR